MNSTSQIRPSEGVSPSYHPSWGHLQNSRHYPFSISPLSKNAHLNFEILGKNPKNSWNMTPGKPMVFVFVDKLMASTEISTHLKDFALVLERWEEFELSRDLKKSAWFKKYISSVSKSIRKESDQKLAKPKPFTNWKLRPHTSLYDPLW